MHKIESKIAKDLKYKKKIFGVKYGCYDKAKDKGQSQDKGQAKIALDHKTLGEI